jgi:hypothetical protein
MLKLNGVFLTCEMSKGVKQNATKELGYGYEIWVYNEKTKS